MEALLEDTMEVTMVMEVTTMAIITTPGRVTTSLGLTMEDTMEDPGPRYRPLNLASTTGAGEGAVTTLPRG